MSELLSLAEQLVERAGAAGAADAEAYAQEQRGREVRIHGGAVESLSASSERGLGLRAWIDGRVGFAYGTQLSEPGLRSIATRACEAARVAGEDEHAAPPLARGAAAELGGLHDPALAESSTEAVIQLALTIERAARASDKRVLGVEQATYFDEEQRVALVSSQGIRGTYEQTSCFAYTQALAGEEAERQSGLGFGLGRAPGALDAEGIGAEAAGRAVAMLGSKKPPSRSTAVLLDPTVAASFIGIIASVLGADAVQRSRSPFAERLGEDVAGAGLSLHEDGTDVGGLSASPFDDEGIPRERNALIERGRLRTFLYDSYTARRGGAASTASAGRAGYRSPPSVSASNLVLSGEPRDLQGLYGEVGDGVLVTDVSGLHSGVNPASGLFSVGASGRRISAGELAEPLREFTIASDLVSMLGAVTALGGKSRWVPFGGSVRTPHVLVGEMAVAGA